MLTAGDKVPSFRLQADDGRFVSSAGLKGKRYVVYFYPKDDTPGCTREAQGFSKLSREFREAGVDVFGVSKDPLSAHTKFRDKYALTVPLLSDPSLETHRAFGAYGKKVLYGKVTEGTIRSTFLIGADGTVERAWSSVKVDGHPEAVLAAARGEAAAGKAPRKSAAKGPAKKAAATSAAKSPAKKANSKSVTKAPANKSAKRGAGPRRP
jgi:peroxiredoxin Q/BCP